MDKKKLKTILFWHIIILFMIFYFIGIPTILIYLFISNFIILPIFIFFISYISFPIYLFSTGEIENGQ